jgi:hypothetical protein
MPTSNGAAREAANDGARPDASCRDHLTARFRARVRRAHALGSRPVGELLVEVAEACPAAESVILDRLERFAALDPTLIAAVGGRDWLEPHQLLRAVP